MPNCPLTKAQRQRWCREWNCQSWKHCPVRPIAISTEAYEKIAQENIQITIWAAVDLMAAAVRKELKKWKERYSGRGSQK